MSALNKYFRNFLFILLGLNQVLPGVGQLIDEVQVEGTFPDGTKLVGAEINNNKAVLFGNYSCQRIH